MTTSCWSRGIITAKTTWRLSLLATLPKLLRLYINVIGININNNMVIIVGIIRETVALNSCFWFRPIEACNSWVVKPKIKRLFKTRTSMYHHTCWLQHVGYKMLLENPGIVDHGSSSSAPHRLNMWDRLLQSEPASIKEQTSTGNSDSSQRMLTRAIDG